MQLWTYIWMQSADFLQQRNKIRSAKMSFGAQLREHALV
jgi:hypothetical protein